jgi:hypothetical protein
LRSYLDRFTLEQFISNPVSPPGRFGRISGGLYLAVNEQPAPLADISHLKLFLLVSGLTGE